MNKTFEDLIADHNNIDLPKNCEAAYNKVKCELSIGKRVYWYFKDELEYCKDWVADKEEDYYKVCKDIGYYSGILVPWQDVEMRGGELEIDDCVVVMDNYPCEKCYPEATWFHLKRLLDNEDLIEIYD